MLNRAFLLTSGSNVHEIKGIFLSCAQLYWCCFINAPTPKSLLLGSTAAMCEWRCVPPLIPMKPKVAPIISLPLNAPTK